MQLVSPIQLLPTAVFLQMFRTLPSRDLFPHILQTYTMPYNKKLADLNRSGGTGKYPTSVLLYWPHYRSINTARPRLDILP
jgi:hypothetical protein